MRGGVRIGTGSSSRPSPQSDRNASQHMANQQLLETSVRRLVVRAVARIINGGGLDCLL